MPGHPNLPTEHEAAEERKAFPAGCGFVAVTLRDGAQRQGLALQHVGMRAAGCFGRSRAAPDLPWPSSASEKPCSNSSTSSDQLVTHCAGILFLSYEKALGGPAGAQAPP